MYIKSLFVGIFFHVFSGDTIINNYNGSIFNTATCRDGVMPFGGWSGVEY